MVHTLRYTTMGGIYTITPEVYHHGRHIHPVHSVVYPPWETYTPCTPLVYPPWEASTLLVHPGIPTMGG